MLELEVFGLRVGLFSVPVISPIIPNVRGICMRIVLSLIPVMFMLAPATFAEGSLKWWNILNPSEFSYSVYHENGKNHALIESKVEAPKGFGRIGQSFTPPEDWFNHKVLASANISSSNAHGKVTFSFGARCSYGKKIVGTLPFDTSKGSISIMPLVCIDLPNDAACLDLQIYFKGSGNVSITDVKMEKAPFDQQVTHYESNEHFRKPRNLNFILPQSP